MEVLESTQTAESSEIDPLEEPRQANLEEVEEEWAVLSCDCTGDFL